MFGPGEAALPGCALAANQLGGAMLAAAPRYRSVGFGCGASAVLCNPLAPLSLSSAHPLHNKCTACIPTLTSPGRPGDVHTTPPPPLVARGTCRRHPACCHRPCTSPQLSAPPASPATTNRHGAATGGHHTHHRLRQGRLRCRAAGLAAQLAGSCVYPWHSAHCLCCAPIPTCVVVG